MKQKIVVSAINSFGGGVLSVVQDCLQEMIDICGNRIEITALVYNKSMVGIEGITYVEFPKARSSWYWRLYYEYVYFYRLSKQLQPDIWLSLADATPRVIAPVQAVYCHNLAPFYKVTRKDAQFDPVLAIYHFIFKYIYQINIRKNKFVIVQQQWLREEFETLFKIKNVLVAYPKITEVTFDLKEEIKPNRKHFTFFYPSIPRVFKNYELISESVRILLSRGISNFDVVFTFTGTENTYAQSIYKAYGHLKQVKFAGELSRKQVFELYKQSDAVIFPSKIETWGMGISEGMVFHKPIFAIDAPYARETAGNYRKIKFFNPASPGALADFLEDFMKDRLEYDTNEVIVPAHPFAKNWRELFDYLGMNN